jgi:starch-binding outer membrane protein, SusD/RagB family
MDFVSPNFFKTKRISIMKIQIFSKLFLVGLLVAFSTQSCTNLDETPFSELTDDTFPTTEEQFISALGATYTSLYGYAGHNGIFSLQEVSSDEIMIPQRGSDWFDGGIWLRVHRHQYTKDEGAVANGWNFLYGGINNCNRVIALFETLVQEGKVSTEQATAFIGEVKVLRALFYYWLLDAYGNVPIVTSFADADPNPATKSRTEVFNFVESELKTNVPNLSKKVDGSTYARMNYYVGQAILAKLYLNAEVYTGTARWADAVTACNEVINSGLYSLEGNYFANFNARNETSKENIFVIPYDRNQATGFFLPAMTLHYGSQETFNLTFQPWNGYCTLQEFYNSYGDTDTRKGEYGNQKVRGNFHAGPQFKSNGVDPILDSSADDPGGPELVFDPNVNALEPNAQRQAGARVGKFEFVSGATENLDNDFPIFRYADVILMKAEAMWRQNAGSAEALTLVNQIRNRSSAGEFTSLTADNLLAERGREMFYEGWRRQDLIRFGKYDDPWAFKNASEPCKALFPIPQEQIQANPNLVQNQCY